MVVELDWSYITDFSLLFYPEIFICSTKNIRCTFLTFCLPLRHDTVYCSATEVSISSKLDFSDRGHVLQTLMWPCFLSLSRTHSLSFSLHILISTYVDFHLPLVNAIGSIKLGQSPWMFYSFYYPWIFALYLLNMSLNKVFCSNDYYWEIRN